LKDDGYEIIEPRSLEGLFSKPMNFTFAVAVFSWLIRELRTELGQQLDGVYLDVICARYLGAYPALGVRYDTGREGVRALIDQTIENLLTNRSVASLVAFIEASDTDWELVTSRLMTTEP
jgi:hypothetical protein